MTATKSFADDNLSRGEEVSWTRVYPTDLLKEVARRGWFGALIPREYGGIDVGVTGCCIVAEQLSRICIALAGACSVTMYGGAEQLLKFGLEEQKRRWLPRFVNGVVGAICITEPTVGSDAASIDTTAKRSNDEYIIDGKKRFITNAGLADIYLVFARTSDSPRDIARHQHLSAFIIERGAPGFTVERINELGGWVGLPNGFLDFNEVRVLAENRIGAEGDGWKILVDGLNFERTLFSAEKLGPMGEAIRYAVCHAQRRIQFGQPTIESEVTRFKIADMIARLKTARLVIYHAAQLLDLNAEAALETTLAKLHIPDAYDFVMNEASQVMGGDAWTRFYPLNGFLRDARVNHVAAGTDEVMKLVIFKQGMRALAKDLKMPTRRIHERLNAPMSTPTPIIMEMMNEANLLSILADDYRVNPGLHMSREDVKRRFDRIDDETLDNALIGLEQKALVRLHRDRKNVIQLVKATYAGLRKANPQEHYQWFPEWMNKNFIF